MARCPDCIHQYCCKYDRFFGVNEVENKCIYFKPTADVAEVKHGKWLYEYSGECLLGTDAPLCQKCSECGEYTVEEEKYCPNCGAIMDGVDHFADVGKIDIEITDFHIGNVSKMVLPWFSADNKSLLEKVLFFHKMDYPSEMDMELIVIIEGAIQPTILFYDGTNFYSEEANGDICFHKVTHWMPLPTPPEKGDIE